MPSNRPERQTTEERIRARRLRLKRRMDASPRGCVGCAVRGIMLAWGAWFLFCIGWAVSGALWERWHMVLFDMKQVAPGMTEAEVRALFPRRMQLKTFDTDTPRPGTRLVAEDRPVVRALDVRGPEKGRAGSWLEMLLEADWDGGVVYFDAEGIVVGLYYNAYHARWEPEWGKRADCSGE